MAKITAHSGVLKMIGAHTVKGNIVKTTVMEIGDEAIRNVVYTDYLSNYIERGLGSAAPLAFAAQKSLGMAGPHIFAVKVDGKVYRDDEAIKGNDLWITVLCFASLITPGAFLTVPYLLYRALFGKRKDAAARNLAAQQL